jgi:threonine dehydratase
MKRSDNMVATPISGRAVNYDDVKAAADRISVAVNRTPILTSRVADGRVAAKVFFKCENFQRTGAFKFRGAFNAIAALSDDDRRRGVVAFSSGNHAQAIASAGRILGVATTLIMPEDAPRIKIEATREYGGEVITYDRYKQDREAIAQDLAAERGSCVIPSFDHPCVIAGQGTAVKELIEDVGPLDRLFVPLGGGGLLAGAALAVSELSEECAVIGVEPEAGNDGQRSFRSGQVIRIPVPRSIADGALVTHVGARNFSIMQRLVADVVTVADSGLLGAMRFFFERMKIVVEPTGCLAAAAVFSRAFHKPGERIGVVISGGNVDLMRFVQLVG